MSLRPQAHDIINFWLFYTLARSKLHFNKIPWEKVMISGFVLDPKGEKMSKSKGNVVAPQEVIKKYGADALRHWATKAGLGEDLRWNEEEITASKRTVIKLWNASRFCFLHLNQKRSGEAFNAQRSSGLALKHLENEDKWILHYLQETIKNYDDFFQKYEFKKAREVVDNFFWKKFCDNYLEFVKFRLYEEAQRNQNSALAAKWCLYKCLLSIIKLYAPIMPFITEEIYQEYFIKQEKTKSIHICLLPKVEPRYKNHKVAKEFNKVIEVVKFIRKYRSEHNLSPRKELPEITIEASDKRIQDYSDFLKKVCLVNKIKWAV